MPAAFETLPRPDWAGTTTVAVSPDAPRDALVWAKAIFNPRNFPTWVKGLFVVREAAVRVLRLPPGDPRMLAVDRMVGDEALIDTDDVHLHFAAAVRTEPGLVHVTTAVQFKGWRGQLYFAPVRLLHDAVTRAMIARAARVLAS